MKMAKCLVGEQIFLLVPFHSIHNTFPDQYCHIHLHQLLIVYVLLTSVNNLTVQTIVT